MKEMYKLFSLTHKMPSSLLQQAVIERQHTGYTLEGEGSGEIPPSQTGQITTHLLN